MLLYYPCTRLVVPGRKVLPFVEANSLKSVQYECWKSKARPGEDFQTRIRPASHQNREPVCWEVECIRGPSTQFVQKTEPYGLHSAGSCPRVRRVVISCRLTAARKGESRAIYCCLYLNEHHTSRQIPKSHGTRQTISRMRLYCFVFGKMAGSTLSRVVEMPRRLTVGSHLRPRGGQPAAGRIVIGHQGQLRSLDSLSCISGRVRGSRTTEAVVQVIQTTCPSWSHHGLVGWAIARFCFSNGEDMFDVPLDLTRSWSVACWRAMLGLLQTAGVGTSLGEGAKLAENPDEA
jgi:hypothetical protein